MFNSNYEQFQSVDNNYEQFQPLDKINPVVRAQQYGFNGRIFLEPDRHVKQYELYQDSSHKQDTNVSIISNMIVPNALSRSYFSNDNIECLQRQIIQQVYNKSQKQISKQSYQELQIIMKSIYLQFGKNFPDNIDKQISILNTYVIDECVRIIVPNLLQYKKYLDEISNPVPVMPRAEIVSNKGTKWGDLSSLIPSYNNE